VTAAPARRLTIVCVDDDMRMLRSLREQLLRGLGAGCDIELASSGDEALQLLAELAAEGTPVPLLISDHIMPGMRGSELLTSVHRSYPQMLTILLTGQAEIDAVGRAVNEANLYRLITKPWLEDDLIRTVKEALRRVDQDQQLAQRSAALAASNDRLEHSLQLLQSTMDATLDGLLVLGQGGEPVQINRQLVELWAVPEALACAAAGSALLDHLLAQLRDAAAPMFGPQDGCDTPTVLELTDGRAIEYLCRAHLMRGERVGTVYSFRDVTQRERNTRLIRHQALHDSLSGLPNRLQFSQALEQALALARSTHDGLAVLFVDLDHFKRVNDTLGHDLGDTLLKRVAERLSRCIREGDLIARWGGDEFTVLAPRMHGSDEAAALARRILDALQPPFLVEQMSLQISASVGVASYPADGEDGQALLRRADMALYRVKEEGRNGFQTYRHPSSTDIGADVGLSLETDLRRAIDGNELLLHYQPQIDTRTGLITGIEALARWPHPVHGWIGPDVFIPIAERTGMIVQLGEWVLHTACRQAVSWQQQGRDGLRVAVNLSAVQFDRCDLQAVVMQALSSSGLAPGALELEVTEAVALRHIGATASTLDALRYAGVRVALDDFGTGYASLTYLKQLPCDTLKIDRSFTHGLEAGDKDAAIIHALVALANGLGLRVIAEGVETAQVADVLQHLGCWTMQGYFFSRPVSAQELTALWRLQPPMFTPVAGIKGRASPARSHRPPPAPSCSPPAAPLPMA
jgi:diguanylate cyclase (GGDEF)-like protein